MATSLFVGCSDEGSAVTSTSDKLLRGVLKDKLGNVIETQSHEYAGEKLSCIVYSTGNYNKAYYTGDFITRIEFFRDNVLSATGTIAYNSSGKISSCVTYSGGNGYRTSYGYNSDNTVTVTEYTGDLTSQTTVTKTHKVFLENDVAVKIESYGTGENSGITYTREYTYDNKNNPMNAILGYGRLTFYEIGSVVTPNNITQIVYSRSDMPETTTTVSTYVYNSQNFPTSRIETSNGVLLTTAEFFY